MHTPVLTLLLGVVVRVDGRLGWQEVEKDGREIVVGGGSIRGIASLPYATN